MIPPLPHPETWQLSLQQQLAVQSLALESAKMTPEQSSEVIRSLFYQLLLKGNLVREMSKTILDLSMGAVLAEVVHDFQPQEDEVA